MTSLELKKLKVAISYFINKYYEESGFIPYKEDIYKFLFLVELNAVKKLGRQIFGLTFKEVDGKPVPIELMDDIVLTSKVDLNIFTVSELEIIIIAIKSLDSSEIELKLNECDRIDFESYLEDTPYLKLEYINYKEARKYELETIV